MEYYNPIKRRVFFWILTILYLAVIPVVIGYSFGYRYSMHRGVFVYGGSITIESNPSRVTVRINDQPAPRGRMNYLNNSYHIDGLHPGDYLVEISHDNYASWAKKVPVHSGMSTEFWNVLLTRNDYAPTELPASDIDRFFLSPERDNLAYTSAHEGEFLVNTLDVATGRNVQVFSSFDYTFADESRENIEWSPQGNALVIPLRRNTDPDDNDDGATDRAFFVVNLESGKGTNLNDILPDADMRSIRWSPSERNTLYFLQRDSLFKLNLNDVSTPVEIARDILCFDIGNGGVYVIERTNGMIFRKNLLGEHIEQISTSPVLEGIDRGNPRIIAYDESRIAVLASDGRLAVHNRGEVETETRILSTDSRDIQFSNDGKKLLFWNERAISVYFTREWDVQPKRAEGDVLEIARFYNPVSNVHWSKSYEHVIYSTKEALQLIELDRRDRQNIMTIVKLSDGTKTRAFSDINDNRLYFTDTQADLQQRLFTVEFPEKSGLFSR